MTNIIPICLRGMNGWGRLSRLSPHSLYTYIIIAVATLNPLTRQEYLTIKKIL